MISLIGVLEAIQQRRTLPEKDWQTKVRSWIGIKLKSDRNVKSRAATNILLRKLQKRKESRKKSAKKSKKKKKESQGRNKNVEISDDNDDIND